MDDKELFECSMYLAKLTLSSVSDLYSAADNIKSWLKTCAKIMGKRGLCTAWTTPLNLPCMQPYFQYNVKPYKDKFVSVNKPRNIRKINLRKQQTAFPPNQIHSLDSTHMLMTSNECQKQNINFTSIHDSFWVLPNDTDQLNVIIREEFIKLHSMPLLENLKNEFEQRMPGVTFPDIPEKGTFDLNDIKKIKYFFC